MWRQTEFYDTPIMPTYMISLVISDFKCFAQAVNSKFINNFSVEICSTIPYNELTLALNISKYSIVFLENYLNSSFHLPKISKNLQDKINAAVI
jgi:aminopeptidase N